MNSENEMAKYRGVLVDENTARLFLLAEREICKEIDRAIMLKYKTF